MDAHTQQRFSIRTTPAWQSKSRRKFSGHINVANEPRRGARERPASVGSIRMLCRTSDGRRSPYCQQVVVADGTDVCSFESQEGLRPA
jgi:hypothetical protein